eukprot:jgi/Tetstr1/447181/TSEL_034618.t1
MTSNHPERLDPALVRPGRIDANVRFGRFTGEDIAQMASGLVDWTPRDEEHRIEVAQSLPDDAWTPAECIRIFLEEAGDPESAFNRLRTGLPQRSQDVRAADRADPADHADPADPADPADHADPAHHATERQVGELPDAAPKAMKQSKTATEPAQAQNASVVLPDVCVDSTSFQHTPKPMNFPSAAFAINGGGYSEGVKLGGDHFASVS